MIFLIPKHFEEHKIIIIIKTEKNIIFPKITCQRRNIAKMQKTRENQIDLKSKESYLKFVFVSDFCDSSVE